MTIQERRDYAKKRYHIRMKDPVYRAARAKHSREYAKRYRKTPKGKLIVKESWNRWYRKPGVIAKLRRYQRENHRLWRYGLRRSEVDELIRRQKGVCVICKKKPKRWTADHDHRTGKFRGLLCNVCNAGLGGFRDSISILKRAILYLKRNR